MGQKEQRRTDYGTRNGISWKCLSVTKTNAAESETPEQGEKQISTCWSCAQAQIAAHRERGQKSERNVLFPSGTAVRSPAPPTR
jgi:hypothetical protein